MSAQSGRVRAGSARSVAWLSLGVLGFLGAACSGADAPSAGDAARPNILLLVADDLNWDSVGVYGCSIPGTTPNIDRLAAESMRFQWAHVNVSVCQPSRAVLLTGRYSHRSGGEGFGDLRIPGVPLLPGVLREAGYRVGAMGKLRHSTPYADFEWDLALDRQELGMGRSPELFEQGARAFIEGARDARAPFFLMANSHDPHRPFPGFDPPGWYQGATPASNPSRTFAPEESPVPGFLPELPLVKQEIAAYYGAVRRCDDTVGRVMRVLEETGVADRTIVVFLSDNGMAFPFAKAGCYLHSTRTPLVVRWPGRVAPGSICPEALVSGVDLMPTLLEAAGVALPEGLDGSSFVPLLLGREQAGRDLVFTQYGRSATGESFPMRCVQSRRFGYIFNPWSNGAREFERPEQMANGTFQVMLAASSSNPGIAARAEFLRKRCVEEFYDFEQDPDALRNLVDDPAYAGELERMRAALESWMQRFEDPALAAFRARESLAAREAFMTELERLGGD